MRLVWALAISLAFHLVATGADHAEQKFHWLEAIHWPAWVKTSKLLAQLVPKKEIPPPRRPQEAPLMFVDVSPAQATPEPPKEAKYYAPRNSQAANPDPDKDTSVPKISGTQTHVAKTEDVTPQKFTPLQPLPPPTPAPKAPEPQPEEKAKPTQTPGDLAVGKPDPIPHKDEGEVPRPKPKTVVEAKMRQQENRPARPLGPRMKQDGGVKRHLELSAVDAKATPFGAYDSALVAAISQRWYDLLGERQFAGDGRGRVVLHFSLHYDGRITDMSVAERDTTAPEVLRLLCEKAVLDPAPFAPWPSDMRHMMGSDIRNIQFTFYYD